MAKKPSHSEPDYTSFAHDCAATQATRAVILQARARLDELRRDSRLAQIRYHIGEELLTYMCGGEMRGIMIELDDDEEGLALVEHLVTKLGWPRELLHWSTTLYSLEVRLKNEAIEALIKKHLNSE